MRRSLALQPGVWGILATPFHDEDLSIDVDSIWRLVDLYRQVGADGVVALGVLGEAVRLDSAERRLVLRTVVEAAGDLPVVAGMSATATQPAIEEALRAAEAGADAAMVLVQSPDADRLAEHLRRVAGASGLGIVVQDHPATTGVVITPGALAAAVRLCDVAVAIKAESPPTAPTIAALVREVGVPVFGGLGGVSLLDELLAGSAGAMTGLAVPEALVRTVRAWRSGGYEAARQAYLSWMPLVLCEAQEKISLAIRKEILRRRGIISGARVRPPGSELPPAVRAALDAHLKVIDVALLLERQREAAR
jgi:4-hydroxy-tetrahydrodipicolinate synthase